MSADLEGIQELFDPLCVVAVTINPESRVSVTPGYETPNLVAGEWTSHLVKIVNEAGVTAPLFAVSQESCIAVDVFTDRPLNARLSGVGLEYRIVMLKAGESGKISTVLTFDVGQGTQDLGFRSDLLMNFEAVETAEVILRPVDENGDPTTAAFEIRDSMGRSWPPQFNRVEPDFRFHPQVYRANGESVRLPEGEYSIRVTRGPEYLPSENDFRVTLKSPVVDVALERWIDPSTRGWWSGDHHIHAAGCKHYVL